MKKIILLLLISTLCYSQESDKKELTYNDYKISNGELIWTHVFEYPNKTSETIKNDLTTQFKTSSFFETIDVVDEIGLSMSTKLHKVNYKKYGGTYMGTSTVFSRDEIVYNVLVYIKDGKYMCEVKNISVESPSSSWASNNSRRKVNFEEFLYNKSFNTWKVMYKNVLDLLEKEFYDYLSPKTESIKMKDF